MYLISILIPTLNEADNIDPLLGRLFDVRWPESVKIEVVFVDDSSTDETRPKILKWQEHFPVRLISREAKDGLASAVVAGAQEVRGDFVVVMDADLSHPPDKLPELIKPLLGEQADVVIGSRYTHGGATPEWPLSRKIASRLASIPAYLFTDANDPMAGFFATRTEYLKSLRPDIPGFKVGLELLAYGGDNFRVHEVPIIFHDRFEGFSKMNKKVILDYYDQVLELGGFRSDLVRFSRLVTLLVLGVLMNTLLYSVFNSLNGFPGMPCLAAGAISWSVLSYSMYRLWRGTQAEAMLGTRQLAAAVTIFLSSLGLQGSGYYMLAPMPESSSPVAICVASIIGTGWFIINSVLFVFSDLHVKDEKVRIRLFCVAAILFSLLLRLCNLGNMELLAREAYLWTFSQNLTNVPSEFPPLSACIVFISDYLVGTSEFAMRFPAFILWLGGAFFLYRLCNLFYNRTTALIALMLFASLPGCFGAGFFMTRGALLVTGWIVASFYMCKAIVSRDRRDWVYFAIISSFGLAVDTIFFIYLGSVLAYLFLSVSLYRIFKNPGFYLFLGVLTVLSLPLLLSYFQISWLTNYLPRPNQIDSESVSRIMELGGYMLATITPVGLLSLIYGFVNRSAGTQATGSYLNLDSGYRLRSTLFVYHFSLTLILLVLISLHMRPEFNWASAITISLIPFLAAMWQFNAQRLGKIMMRLWKLQVIALFAVYMVVFHYYSYGIPTIDFGRGPVLRGYQNLAQQINAEVLEHIEQNDDEPVVVGMDKYGIASGLSFYRKKQVVQPAGRVVGEQITVGWHLFDWHARMFEIWLHPETIEGRSLLIVAQDQVRAEFPYFQNRVQEIKPLKEIVIVKNGLVVGTFYMRLLSNYAPQKLTP
ncbi:MAG: glycosyltransferase [Desulfobulbaceae bacterium]|nr:MAG: glycosyltransferase [Desulfobulbaceae bacterium]